MSYMAAAARYTANCTQHSRYTTRSSTRHIKFQYEERHCIFGLANFFPSPATSRGSNPSSVLLIVPPVCFTLHLHTAEHEAK